MKANFNFTLFVTFKKELKKFAVIEAKASGKTPVFQGNHPLGRVALFQEKILLKQKQFSFFGILKQTKKFIHKL